MADKPTDPAAQVAAPVTTAPAVPAKKPETVKDWLQSTQFLTAVAQALPKHMTAERQMRIALAALTRTPKLAECTPASVLRCMLDLSAAGLEPNGRDAHLIPFRDNRTNTMICTLIIDYRGMVQLAMRSGAVSSIHADLVCENDKFTAITGDLTHEVDYRKPRGAAFAAYCLVKFKDGGHKSEVMTMDEIESIRKRSRSGNSGPWQTDHGEMSKKTVTRRCLKWVPLSPEIREKIESDDDVIDIETIKTAPGSMKEAFADHPSLPMGDDLPMEGAP